MFETVLNGPMSNVVRGGVFREGMIWNHPLPGLGFFCALPPPILLDASVVPLTPLLRPTRIGAVGGEGVLVMRVFAFPRVVDAEAFPEGGALALEATMRHIWVRMNSAFLCCLSRIACDGRHL